MTGHHEPKEDISAEGKNIRLISLPVPSSRQSPQPVEPTDESHPTKKRLTWHVCSCYLDLRRRKQKTIWISMSRFVPTERTCGQFQSDSSGQSS